MQHSERVNENCKAKNISIPLSAAKPIIPQKLQKGDQGYKKVRTCWVFGGLYNKNHRQAIVPAEKIHQGGNTMALSNIAGWNENTAGSACGASDKPAACGASEKPAACGAGDKPAEAPAACGAADKPEEKPAACGSACGAGDK